MRTLLLGIIVIATGFLTVQSYRLLREYRKTEREYEELLLKMTPLAADNAALQANLESLRRGYGAERELHNAGYAAHGEKMIIILPKNPTP